MTKNPLYRLYIAVAAIVLFGVLQYQFNIIPIKSSHQAEVPTAVELPTDAPSSARVVKVDPIALPTSTVSTTGVPVRFKIIAWNANMGLHFAVGGTKSTKGSLMEKYGVRASVERYDDTPKAQADQIKFAERLHAGDPNPSEGVHFVNIMGDGTAQYLAGINKQLSKLGPDYVAEVVGSVGYSRGEDAFMGPEDWKTDPQRMKGGLVAGVLKDGDWNIAMYYLQQNGIKNNPDETTFDPDALNWFATNSFVEADEAYIAGKCEDRKVVKDGKIQPGAKHHVCVTGVVTWTPGDVEVAKKKGGVVKLLSTKENAFQMPAVLIGIHKWNMAHSKVVEGILKATSDGADQVRSSDAALQFAGRVSAKVYGEQTPSYWVRYFKGVTEPDAQKVPIALGGSSVSNIADQLVLFGLADGTGDVSSSMFRATYEGFGNIAKQQYPKDIPSFPTVSEAVNLTFLRNVATTMLPTAKAEDTSYEDVAGSISDKVAQTNWDIQFDTGKATFTPQAKAVLDQVYNALAVNKLYVQVDGHTDNTGNPAANVALSTARAKAVETYLSERAPALFPESRLSVQGFGDSKPIASNASPDGRATNRRVTITIGNK